MKQHMLIGTRGSSLALAQTNEVVNSLKKVAPNIRWEVLPIKTQGDRVHDTGTDTMEGKSQFTLWHRESHPKPEKTTLAVDSGPTLKLEFSGKREPHILRILLPTKPARVVLDGAELQEGDAWQFDAAHHRLIIKTYDYAQGRYEIITASAASQSGRAPAPEKDSHK
jgi:hypothetical protein